MYLIGFYSKKNLSKLCQFDYYKKSFKHLQGLGIIIIYFYEEDESVIVSPELIDEIKEIGILLVGFTDQSQIIDHLKGLSGKICINTFEEQEIGLTNRIKQALGQKITDNPEIFLNKHLQREIIGKAYPETTVQYKFIPLADIQRITEHDLPPLPCIIKPTVGVQSSGVCKIESYDQYIIALSKILEAFGRLKYKKLFNQNILVEEFIDGKMYTIDYYIDENQNITLSKPVFVTLGIDYGVNDFCNIARFISDEIEAEVDKEKLKEFIKKTVLGGGIRNTFVHHEFKINSKGEFKTIEINGRIGGFRLDMYQIAYDMDILTFPFINNIEEYTRKKNIATFTLYPAKECIFNGYNESILDQIYTLSSFYSINKGVKSTGAFIGLTSNGHSRVGTIVLANKNFQQFSKDIECMKHIYFDIIKFKEII